MIVRSLGLMLVSGLLLAGCSAPGPAGPAGDTGGLAAQQAENLNRLPVRPGKDLDARRLRPGLVPPTNRWFSGLVFGPTAQPVFPLPLSFGLQEQGFAFGVPTVTTGAKSIIGGYAPHVQARPAGVERWEVSAYDELSVTLTGSGGGRDLGSVVLVEGSPFVRYTSPEGGTLTLNLPFQPAEGGAFIVQAGEYSYGLVLDRATVSGAELALEPGGSATWFPVPRDGDASTLAELARHPVRQTSASYAIEGDQATTSLRYATDGGPTAFARLPHQQHAADGCDLGSYASIYGTLKLCRGEELSWSTRTYPARPVLDLSGLGAAEKQEIAQAVRQEVRAAKPYPADSYFGGKAVYRDAQLWAVARQVDAGDSADVLHKRVVEELSRWAEWDGCTRRNAHCFAYDQVNRGVIGYSPNFGSDEYNDHHFHYGYFLHAAAILGADDPALVARLRPVLDLVALDIANPEASPKLPRRRTFDAYHGHSWASGTAPFADGNNQESSSEAVHAWSGVTLWAQVTGNPALQAEGRWLHAVEAQTARAYWTDFDPGQPVYQGFEHTIVPLNWGGKRDYATWFSAEPAAALAILILPAGPSSEHLAGDPERIRRNIAEATAGKGFEQPYGDYLLMYHALAGEPERQQALAQARSLQSSLIDDGNSRAYLLAWLHSVRRG